MVTISCFSGTVVTGRVTRGKLKVGIDVDILGYDKQFKAKVNGKLGRFS